MRRVKNYQKFTERAVFYVIQSVIALSPLREFLVIFYSQSTNILLKTLATSIRRITNVTLRFFLRKLRYAASPQTHLSPSLLYQPTKCLSNFGAFKENDKLTFPFLFTLLLTESFIPLFLKTQFPLGAVTGVGESNDTPFTLIVSRQDSKFLHNIARFIIQSQVNRTKIYLNLQDTLRIEEVYYRIELKSNTTSS